VSQHKRQADLAAKINLDDLDDAPPAGAYQPKTAPGQTMLLQGKYEQAKAENEALRELVEKSQLTGAELLIANLVPVPERQRKLTDEEYIELRENLRNNPLVTPITVRSLTGGKFEIISGHNRCRAYSELGRETIPAVVREMPAEQADVVAFYANLLQPNLSDFEKFLGFRKRHRSTRKTYKELAIEAGISTSQFDRIMSFEKLPEIAQHHLETRPETLGSDAAKSLAILASEGHSGLVSEAVEKIVNKQMNQKDAVEWVKRQGQPERSDRKPAAKPETIYLAGKKKFCSIYRADKVLKVAFEKLEDAQDLSEKIQAVIRDYVKSNAKK